MMSMPRVEHGWPHPLGASWDGNGTNFAVFSEGAEKIELCLFDQDGSEETIVLPDHYGATHHGYVPGVGPGQMYGFRAYGPWNPAQGLRFNPAKLLMDPYARAIEGNVDWSGPLAGHDRTNGSLADPVDSAPYTTRSLVIDPTFDWGDDSPPMAAWDESVIYETHVKGLTKLHPEVPEQLRGTYAGLATEPVLEYLVGLGVTAVELLPVHHFLTEGFLKSQGLSNYWGYSTLGFFATHRPYAATSAPGGQVNEFKSMVKALHSVGIEVILDVVYNHTAEGSAEGPTLSFRGLDNHTYYRLESDRGNYVNYSGTGNTWDVRHRASLRLIMDSLRYWVEEMHVDGFRFDLATALARDPVDFNTNATFFDLVHQDPIVNRVKLIAEPWDVGPSGYQLGNFPPLWSEWNAWFRDDVRDFWRGENGSLSRMASRFAGSSDLFDSRRRRPRASINFVTSHDGFTLSDLVSYNHRHNEANGENGRDGHSDNRSWNSGVEGPTSDQQTLTVRRRRAASMMATILLSQGVPMICGGDEIGRTQRGNNNAYNQDNPTTWYDWENIDSELLELTRSLVKFRADHPNFRRRHFFTGESEGECQLADLGWYRPDGLEMTRDDWAVGYARAVAAFVNGGSPAAQGSGREPNNDHCHLVLFNSGTESVEFVLPCALADDHWRLVLDTAGQIVDLAADEQPSDQKWMVGAWGVVVLERSDHLNRELNQQSGCQL